MRIAIDARYLDNTPSSLSQYCENLIEHLAEVDEENEYFVFVHSSFPKTLKVGENFQVRKVRSSPVSWRTLTRFHRVIERAQPCVLHALYPIVPPFWRGKLIVTFHDLRPVLLREDSNKAPIMGSRPGRTFTKWMFPYSVRRATWMTSVSDATKQAIGDLYPQAWHKTIVMRSGLEPAFSAPLDDSTRELVLAKHRPPERFIFYTGAIRPGKNVGTMLSAFASLRESNPTRFGSLHFVLDTPKGRGRREMERLAQRLDVVDAVRFVDPLNDSERRVFYAESEALFFICKNEGFGFPVLEAQAAGTPVLAADNGALPEVAGPGALLVEPDHTQSILEGLQRILTDEALRIDLVETGRMNMKRFSWKSTAEELRNIYNLLI